MPKPKHERRSALRQRVRVTAAVEDLRTGRVDPNAEIRDLSEHGLFLLTHLALDPGANLVAMFALPRKVTVLGHRLARCEARVVRVQVGRQGGFIGVGAVIVNIEGLP